MALAVQQEITDRLEEKQMNARSSSDCAAMSPDRPYRTSVANERLQRNRTGDVVLQLKSPYRDGTTHIVMSPLEFMQQNCRKCAALVPRPRLHLIRFHDLSICCGQREHWMKTRCYRPDPGMAEFVGSPATTITGCLPALFPAASLFAR
jgi:Putative transposase